MFDDSLRNLLGFNETILSKKYNLSRNPVDISSSDNIFLECDIAHGVIFKGRRSGKIHNWTMTVDLGYKYDEKFAGGATWYTMESKAFISSICSISKNEHRKLVYFNGQSLKFRLSMTKI